MYKYTNAALLIDEREANKRTKKTGGGVLINFFIQQHDFKMSSYHCINNFYL